MVMVVSRTPTAVAVRDGGRKGRVGAPGGPSLTDDTHPRPAGCRDSGRPGPWRRESSVRPYPLGLARLLHPHHDLPHMPLETSRVVDVGIPELLRRFSRG